MKQLFLALAIGLTAMGCNRDGKEESLHKSLGYVNRSFCENGYIIDEIKGDTIGQTFLPSNLPKEFKSDKLRLHHTEKIMKVEFTYKITSDTPNICAGFYGYDKKIELITIKKIN